MKITNVHEYRAYDKNNAKNVKIWRHCKFRKCVDEKKCANAQYLVTKQPNLVSKRNFIKKARSNIFDCTR